MSEIQSGVEGAASNAPLEKSLFYLRVWRAELPRHFGPWKNDKDSSSCLWGCLQPLLCLELGSYLILRAAFFGSHFSRLSAVVFLIKGQEVEGLVTIVTIY